MKILIIRLSSIGDILLSTPLLRQLRIKFPEAQIDFAVSGKFAEIIRFNPHINNIIEYDKTLSFSEQALWKKNFIKSLPFGKYDIIVDLQRNLRSMLLRKGLGRRVLKIKKHRLNKWSLTLFKKTIKHQTLDIPEIYRQTVKALGIEDDGKGLELWLHDEKFNEIYKIKTELSNSIIHNENKVKIAIAPGAYHATKRWLTDRFAALAKMLISEYDAKIILLGGEKDKVFAKEILLTNKENIEDYTGSDSILKTAEKLSACNLLITNDTGVMHIAASRQVPVVAIFGSTVTGFGFAPYRVRHVIVEKELPCRPCTHIGRENCPKKHFNCMNLISVDDVFNAAASIIGNKIIL